MGRGGDLVQVAVTVEWWGGTLSVAVRQPAINGVNLVVSRLELTSFVVPLSLDEVVRVQLGRKVGQTKPGVPVAYRT